MSTESLTDNIDLQPKHAGGRPLNPVWNHFERNPLPSAGHFSAKCTYCKIFMPRGRPHALEIHLAKDCRSCPNEIQIEYLTKICENDDNDEEESSKKRKTNQTVLDDHWDSTAEISKSRKKIIDQAWIKAFVSCGIPFSAIENPFFINAIKSLRSSYNPPSRESLSGKLLNREVVKVNSKVNNILKNENNLTL